MIDIRVRMVLVVVRMWVGKKEKKQTFQPLYTQVRHVIM